MSDMVFAPTFADLDAEREVVLEEIAMLDDSPQELVHDLASEALFGTHPLGRPVIGRAEVIRSISRRSLERYHKAAYGSENVVLAAAGNVDHARARRVVRGAPRRCRRSTRPGSAAGRPARRARLPLPAARTPSSTTSAWSGPASRTATNAVTRPRCSTRSSAAPRPHGSSRRSARSAGWRTRSTPSAASTETPARRGSTSAHARTTSTNASRSPPRELLDVGAGQRRPGRAASGRRRTSRAGSCSRWSRPPAG